MFESVELDGNPNSVKYNPYAKDLQIPLTKKQMKFEALLFDLNAADSDDKFVYIASDMLSKILIREAPLNKRAKLRKHASQILMRGQGDMRRSQML